MLCIGDDSIYSVSQIRYTFNCLLISSTHLFTRQNNHSLKFYPLHSTTIVKITWSLKIVFRTAKLAWNLASKDLGLLQRSDLIHHGPSHRSKPPVSVHSQLSLILLIQKTLDTVYWFFALAVVIHNLYYTHGGCLKAVPRSEKADKMENTHTQLARTPRNKDSREITCYNNRIQ